jgi:hypothetical protein
MIDLSTCVPGQKVRFANGNTGIISEVHRRSGTTELRSVKVGDSRWWWYTLNGSEYHHEFPDPNWQIVKILPIETPEEPSMIDLSTCVPGQTVEYRNGTTGEYYGLNRSAVYSHITRPFPPTTSIYTYIRHRQDGDHSDIPDGHNFDVVKILPLEPPMTDKSTESQVVRSKIDVFTWTDPNDNEKTERVEVTVDDLGVWITSCTGNVREEMNIDNKDLAIALAKAILEGYSEK